MPVDPPPRFAPYVGAIAAIGVGGLLTPTRDWLGNTNVALVLVVVVALAGAIGGRLAGVLTSVAAALAFNFFHSEPYYSLEIASRVDVITTVLVLVVGLVVGEVAALRTSSQRRAASAIAGTRRLEVTAAVMADGSSAQEVWPVVRDALVAQLHLRDCHYQPVPFADDGLPLIERDGRLPAKTHVFTGQGFALPPGGCAVLVESGRTVLGRIVLEPDPDAREGVGRAERQVAVALADGLAVALRTQP